MEASLDLEAVEESELYPILYLAMDRFLPTEVAVVSAVGLGGSV